MLVRSRTKGTYPGKRALDVGLALAAFVILAPVILAIAGLVWCAHSRPILFVQLRPGLRGQPFALYKFRSMTNATDTDGNLLPAGERTTRFGRLLRKTSLDELPELWNVLRGEMSVVGPRPLLMDYLQHYSPEQMRRHDALPGITGWAQVNGRNNLEWEEKFALDVWYVEHASLPLDLRILAMTAARVLRMSNINKEGYGDEGAEYFRGTSHATKRQ